LDETTIDKLAAALLECKMVTRPAGAAAFARRLAANLYDNGVALTHIEIRVESNVPPRTKWTDQLIRRNEE
jgi:hypothetical protein